MTITESRRNHCRESRDSGGVFESVARFGTERPVVQIHSPRPLFSWFPRNSAERASDPSGRVRFLTVTDGDGNGILAESDPDQLGLKFPIDRRAMPDHPIVVLRWRDGGVAATWSDFGLSAWFRSWPAALEAVLHPLNNHVRVKVRP